MWFLWLNWRKSTFYPVTAPNDSKCWPIVTSSIQEPVASNCDVTMTDCSPVVAMDAFLAYFVTPVFQHGASLVLSNFPANFSGRWLQHVSLVKLYSEECHWTLLMISQHLCQWLLAIKQQALTWANVDLDVCHYLASLSGNTVSWYMGHEKGAQRC